MSKLDAAPIVKVKPHEVMLAVLNRCDDTRELMVQMWLQNPQLAKQGGEKIVQLLSGVQQLSDRL